MSAGHVYPYTEGTKTNVIFFTKGEPTERYLDLRLPEPTYPRSRKRAGPLLPPTLPNLSVLWRDPNGLSKRSESDSARRPMA